MWPFSKSNKTPEVKLFFSKSNEGLVTRVQIDGVFQEKSHIIYNENLRRTFNINPPKDENKVSCWWILGIMPTKDKKTILSAYKKMAMVYHPDHGGSNEKFQTLIRAKETALKNL